MSNQWDNAAKANTTHGMTKTRAFKTWLSMLGRCSPRSKVWERYAGRSVVVCERWKTFENFLADMGEPPDGLTLDRIDNDGNYEPGNCRWATYAEQARNRRTNRLLTHNGETMCVTDWARRIGISRTALHRRIDVLGWPVGRALTEGRMR